MKAHRILGIDTSTKMLAVALAEGEKVIWEQNESEKFKHLEKIFILIGEGLRAARWTMDDIDVVACGLGPGSFIGLRVGLAAVKGLMLAGGKKVVGLSSLDIIAQNNQPETDGAVLVDAHRKKVYASFYASRGGALQKKGADVLLSYKQLMARLKRMKGATVLGGDALCAYGSDLAHDTSAKISFAPEERWYPRGAHIINCAHSAIQKKSFLSLRQLAPHYLRASGAEEVLKKGKRIKGKGKRKKINERMIYGTK